MKGVYIPLREFVAEHKKLVKILEKGGKKEQVKEAKSQMAELLKVLKK
jgi:hypothetical protein